MFQEKLDKWVVWFVFLVLFSSCEKNKRTHKEKHATNPKKIIEDHMVLIPGGSFLMGSNDPMFPDAKPIHRVIVDSFLMDDHEVTNAEFAQFVKETSYITIAERPLDTNEFLGVPKQYLIPGSIVFTKPDHSVSLNEISNWWKYVGGACWKQPLGPTSSIKGKENYPVVHISYLDAVAYANWAQKRLPTEAEWEYAARAGQKSQVYYWGENLKPNNKWRANIFQGNFPHGNTVEDGFEGVAPVQSFEPNSFGIYDLEGNVWEWCADYYRPDYYQNSPSKNPQGPIDSYDPNEPGVIKRVQRGGSFLCSDQYCVRYKAGSRGNGEVKSAANNLGFRCVKDL